LEANLELVRHGLVLYTFGNASGILREDGLVVIKPSGVAYETMKPEDLVVVDLDGKTVEGNLRPSSDLPTHLILYKAFLTIGGVTHTHSRSATSWAQGQRAIPCFGTTHADYFDGPVPVTKPLTPAEIRKDYERNTGLAIVRCVGKRNPLHTPGVLVANHAPFCWGKSPADAAHNAVVLEEIATTALQTLAANSKARPISRALHEKHFFRKHGDSAYYGQK
jgi:L-ribulose-5-phosphate 4-epimerase